MSLRNRALPFSFAICLAFFLTPVVFAQWGGLNAEFAGAGARALSMGGAFIGLADDATAVEFNPAGIWQLRRPELAFQYVYTRDKRETRRLEKPSFAVRKTGETDSYLVPSFISLVYPMQHLTIGLSELTNVYYERSYQHPTSLVRVHEEAKNYAIGLTAATEIIERLSVGATLRHNMFRFKFDSGSSSQFSDEAFSYNVGLLWRPLGWLNVGTVYKSSQKLKGRYQEMRINTQLPETIGAGIAFLPNDRLRLLVDIDRISWSQFDPNTGDDFVRDDVWRYHLGTEYHLGTWKQTAFLLRGGYMLEESNAFKYEGDNPIMRELTSVRRDIQHLSAGIGIARPRYQIDLGIDLTEDNGQDVIASIVYYF